MNKTWPYFCFTQSANSIPMLLRSFYFFYLNTRNLIKIIRQDFIRNEENLRNYRWNEMCSATVLDANGCDITIIEHINTRSMYVKRKAVPRKTWCY